MDAVPHFLCIGAMKAGTTWLHANLRGHAGVWLPPVKELRHFNVLHIPGPHQGTDGDHRTSQARTQFAGISPGTRVPARQHLRDCLAHIATPPFDDAWYRGIFAFRGPGQVSGDISPQYALLPEAGIRHALSLNPGLKVIALLRDPAERALAHMAMHCGPDATAEAVLRLVGGRRWPVYAAQSDYAAWLTRWRDLLPAGALHVEAMPAIRGEPQAVLRRICEFLGIAGGPENFPRAAEPVMVGKAGRAALAPALPALREALAPAYAALEETWPAVAAALRAEG